MYHNCAHVKITNGNGGAQGLDSYPDMFIADIRQTTCKSPLTTAELEFPNMGQGDQVEYGDMEYPLAGPTC